MIIKAETLFEVEDDALDSEDVINIEVGDYVVEKDGDGKEHKYAPSIAIFDMSYVISINKSLHYGYVQCKLTNGRFLTIRMPFDKVERLFKLCKG